MLAPDGAKVNITRQYSIRQELAKQYHQNGKCLPLSLMFVGYDYDLLDLTVRAFGMFSFSFLFSGFAIFGSGFFTALNDGPVSAAISFLRTLVFQVTCVLLFPLWWQVDGIWASIVAAEVMAVAVTLAFLRAKQKRYHY